MFVEHKEQGEVKEAPAKVLKLSEAIRKCGYEHGLSPTECVLARAYREVTGRRLSSDCGPTYTLRDRGFIRTAAETFGVPYHIADEAESLCIEHKSKDQIADWLEAQGY